MRHNVASSITETNQQITHLDGFITSIYLIEQNRLLIKRYQL